MNGFVPIDAKVNAVEQNVITYRNIISPFSRTENIFDTSAKGEVFVDDNFGYVYDDCYLQGRTSIYGEADLLPAYSGDQLAIKWQESG